MNRDEETMYFSLEDSDLETDNPGQSRGGPIQRLTVRSKKSPQKPNNSNQHRNSRTENKCRPELTSSLRTTTTTTTAPGMYNVYT